MLSFGFSFALALIANTHTVTSAPASYRAPIPYNEPQSIILAQQHKISGDFYLRNVKTNQYLSFYRETIKGSTTTNSYTQKTKRSVHMEYKTFDGTSGLYNGRYTGSVISGGNNKCLSSQWGEGQNRAAVSYACKKGGISVAKQTWAFLPPSIAREVLKKSRGQKDDKKRGKKRNKKNHPRSIDLDGGDSVEQENCEVEEDDVSEDSLAILPRGNNDPKFGKGSRFVIIAIDHLHDHYRAITEREIDTFGGYRSQALADLNPDDEGQLWEVIPA